MNLLLKPVLDEIRDIKEVGVEVGTINGLRVVKLSFCVQFLI